MEQEQQKEQTATPLPLTGENLADHGNTVLRTGMILGLLTGINPYVLENLVKNSITPDFVYVKEARAVLTLYREVYPSSVFFSQPPK